MSLFDGIGAATVAWRSLGWMCVAKAEIEPFPSAVTEHHDPAIPNLGDVTKIDEVTIASLGALDLIVFGSPCQDLSVAGKRAGLQGERSGLFYTAITIIDWARQHCGLRYALWENVPGAFSSNGGADFAVVVGELAGMACVAPPKGWGNEGCAVGEKGMVEWSTLDAQWFGVAQRRRRVFALADFGNWAGRPPILLEPESLRGDSAPRRETGQRATGDAEACAHDSGERGDGPGVTHSLRADGFDASEDGTGRGTPLAVVNHAPPRQFVHQRGRDAADRLRERDARDDIANCLETTCNDYSRADGFNMIIDTPPVVSNGASVRRDGADNADG